MIWLQILVYPSLQYLNGIFEYQLWENPVQYHKIHSMTGKILEYTEECFFVVFFKARILKITTPLDGSDIVPFARGRS